MRLRYTLPALADLGAILDYIAAHSPQGARRVQARIQILTDLLLQHPYIGDYVWSPADGMTENRGGSWPPRSVPDLALMAA